MRRVTRPDRGITLVELAIAILVLAIGTVAALRGLDHATRTTMSLDDRTLAQVVVRNRAEELRLYGPSAALPDSVTMANRVFDIETARTATAAGLVQPACAHLSGQTLSDLTCCKETLYTRPD